MLISPYLRCFGFTDWILTCGLHAWGQTLERANGSMIDQDRSGALIDRLGVVRVIRSGLILMSICFLLYPFVQSLNQLYLLHAALAVGHDVYVFLTTVLLYLFNACGEKIVSVV